MDETELPRISFGLYLLLFFIFFNRLTEDPSRVQINELSGAVIEPNFTAVRVCAPTVSSLSLSLSLPRSSEIDGGCYKGAAITAWALVYAVLILPSMAPHKCKVKHFHFPLCCGGNIAICISHVHTPSKILLPFPNRIILKNK